MSAALVRQALEFVDPDESIPKTKKRGGRSRGAAGQDFHLELFSELKQKTSVKADKRRAEREPQDKEGVISKLLKLSEPTLDEEITKKIVKRAVTGKPLFDKVEVKKEEEKSILFPEDNEDKPKRSGKKKKKLSK